MESSQAPARNLLQFKPIASKSGNELGTILLTIFNFITFIALPFIFKATFRYTAHRKQLFRDHSGNAVETEAGDTALYILPKKYRQEGKQPESLDNVKSS